MTTSLRAKLLPQFLGASLLLFFAITTAYGDGNPEYVDGQVIVQCFNPADLPAIAAQYSLDPTPISQVGNPRSICCTYSALRLRHRLWRQWRAIPGSCFPR
jgi:hypothetical protein